jgi:DNA primase
MKFVISGITRSIDDPENKDYHINFKNRVIIPIYEKGKMICLEGRDPFGIDKWEKDLKDAGYDPSKMIYKKVLYPKLSSTNTLFGLSSLDKTKRLYIVEGLMDMISLKTSSEFKNSTCYFGAAITRRQVYLLNKFDEICIISDKDAAGIGTVKRLLKEVSISKKLKLLFPPSGCKDVNDMILGKNSNIRTIDEAVEKNWLSKMMDAREAPLDSLIEDFKNS